MNIVVCVKYVPDATADRHFEDDNTVDRVGVDGLLSELDEYAVEQALQIKEKTGDSTVTVLSVGPEQATDAIRKALQMGADKGVHVVDEAIAGSDALATSLVLAEAISKIGAEQAWDLVVCGMASTDGSMGVVPAMLGERLEVPAGTLGPEVGADGRTARGRRGGGRRRHGAHPPRGGHRHRDRRGHGAAGALGDRPVRRGPLPVLQGH